MDQYLLNIKTLSVEIFNIKNAMSRESIFYIFSKDGKLLQPMMGNDDKVKQPKDFSLPSIRTVYHVIQSLF